MKWLMCKQTLHDSVCYTTSENEDLMYLSYYSFLDYIHSLVLVDFIDFKNYLDKFEIIYIEIDNHSWKIYKEENQKPATFNELVELNDGDKKELSKLDRIKLSLSKYSKVRTYGGESGDRTSPEGASRNIINRETRRGVRIPLQGRKSKF